MSRDSSTIKFSIIIPHFNDLKRLERLLKTIPQRDDIEVIVVDDKSSGEVKSKLLNLTNKYSRVKFVENTTPKKGAGVCRNIGMKYAKGKWLIFADSDDVFISGFYDELIKLYGLKYDIIFFPPKSFLEGTFEEGTRHKVYAELIKNFLNNRDRKSELMLRFHFKTPTSKLVNSKLIKKYNIKFDETLMCNDDMFAVKIGYYAKRILAINKAIYSISQSNYSLSKVANWKFVKDCVIVRLNIYRFLKENLNINDYKLLNAEIIPIDTLLYVFKKTHNIINVLKAWRLMIRYGVSPLKSLLHLIAYKLKLS